MIWQECRWMVLLFVAVCWCRLYIYKPSKWTLFRIIHQNWLQNIIQCHNNNIWKQMCIKKLCYSTETYLRYNVQRGKQVKIYMWYLHHKLVIFQQSRNCFCYLTENEIKGDILGWTTPLIIHKLCNHQLSMIVWKWTLMVTLDLKLFQMFYCRCLSENFITSLLVN